MVNSKTLILDEWEPLEDVGHGKHGVVYKARNIRDNTIAAVKIISLPNDEMMEYAAEEYGNNQAMIDNFVGTVAQNFGNEVESMRKLKDVPYVIKLYDNKLQQTIWRDKTGQAQRGYDIIMVMEYACPLKHFYQSRELRVRDVIDFACDIALGLAECEKRNIIHRDIKDDNLFIGINDDCGKIGDFGVASINTTGLGSTEGMGTPYYMAPEVANLRAINHANYDNTVDIYSLGIVLYKMLNGNKFPFSDGREASARQALDRRLNGEQIPYPRYANKDLGNIILTCCAYRPQDRFRSGSALYRALKAVKARTNEQELDRILPYRYTGAPQDYVPYDYDDYDSYDNSEKPLHDSQKKDGRKGKKKSDNDILGSTMDILADLTGTVATVFRGLLRAVSAKQKDEIEEHYKKRRRRNVIILTSIIVAALMAVLVMLYPKTATFYSDPSDNNRIHVKYLFLPDRRKADAAASYLTVDGNWLYYSNPDEDHRLYRLSIWFGEPELLCEDDCEYDIVIGDYIYFTSYDEGEIMCRIKKDGGGKEVVLPYRCRALKKNGNNIMFVLADTGELKELDTSTIN